MRRSLNHVIGYRLAAKDGAIGRANDFLFDMEQWVVRWLVADTNAWLPGKKVLVSPISLGTTDWLSHLFAVRLTKDEIEHAPPLDADAPVSRAYERLWFNHYGLYPYWGGASTWGLQAVPYIVKNANESPEPDTDEVNQQPLRSVKEVSGYHIQAIDGEIGHVEDFIVDEESWEILFMVVNTRNWLPGRSVLISPKWTDSIDWADKKVMLELDKEHIKGSPPYDPSMPVNEEYEMQLRDYYGRPVTTS